MAETNNKTKRGPKARAAILAGILVLATTPAVAYAAGAPAQMGGQSGALSVREQVMVQDRMASDQGGMPQIGQIEFDGQQPPALPNGEQPVDGQQPPALPNGEQPVDGQQPPALPDGEQPVDGQQPPALPDNVSPMNGQRTSSGDQQPAFGEELTPVQQFIKEFYSFFERILGISN